MPRVINQTKGTLVAEDVRVAASIWSRFWGLMGRKSIPEAGGLLLRPTSSIHTAFMRFPLDIVFLDRQLRVIKIVAGMKPFRATVAFGGAHSALELNAGVAGQAGIQTGDQLALE